MSLLMLAKPRLAAAGAFDPEGLNGTVDMYFWADDPDGSPPSDGDDWPSAWPSHDVTAGDWIRATGATTNGKYRAADSDFNNRACLDTNGFDRGIKTTNTLSLAQEYSIVVVYCPEVANDSFNAESTFVAGDTNGNSTWFLRSKSDNVAGLWAGSWLDSGNDDQPLNQAHIGVFHIDDSASEIYLNGAQVASGDPGANDSTSLRICLNQRLDGEGHLGFLGKTALALFYPGDVLSDSNWATWQSACASHYGITLA